VPRRINLLCDRAMLGAYAHGQPRVTAQMVEKAAREVFGEATPARAAAAGPRPALLAAAAGVAALTLLAALAWGGLWWRGQAAGPPLAGVGTPAERLAAAPAPNAGATPGLAAAGTPGAAAGSAPAGPAEPASALPDGLPAPAAAALPLAASAPDLPLLADPAPVLAAAWADEAAALHDLARLWQGPLAEGEPCERAAAAGLQCHRAGTGLGVLRQLARPAVLVLRGEESAANTGASRSAPSYAILLSVGATGATLAAGDQRWRLSLPALARVWRGEFITYWRTPPGWRSGIDPVEDPQLQTWLLQHLGQSGGLVPGVPLREQVRNFQVANGLQADGRAGPLTLMLLGRADEPQLMQDR
jgi:general secretion pathway protein A